MTVNRERKMVSKEQTSLSINYSSLGSIRNEVQRCIELYGENATVYMRGEAYSDSDKEYPYVYMDVPETDAEMAKRILQEEGWEKTRLENDKANYERLSKIYGEKK